MSEAPKGILKKDAQDNAPRDVKWDETNILLTLHPVDKDYGHMKIDEPKTPYEYDVAGSDDEPMGEDLTNEPWSPPKINPNDLQDKLAGIDSAENRSLKFEEKAEQSNLEEEKAQKDFSKKRAAHYNEFLVMKQAQAAGLMSSEEEEEEETQNNDTSTTEDEAMETDQKTAVSTLAVKQDKTKRRVSISDSTSPGGKDPAKISEFEKKRRAHYQNEFSKVKHTPSNGNNVP